jgi:hypothetical protein
MPMPYPEITNVAVTVIVQRRFDENLQPEAVQWLAEVIRAGLLNLEHGRSSKIDIDKEEGIITISSGPSLPGFPRTEDRGVAGRPNF